MRDDNNLLRLLQLTDPGLPIGAFSHSSGLETYVQEGIVHDQATAREFITGMLTRSLQYTDAAFTSLAYDAAAGEDWEQVVELDRECNAVKLSRELREASVKTGLRILKIFEQVYPGTMTARYKTAVETQEIAGHYCIAFGLYAATFNISKAAALTGFYYNAAAGMVTNSVKLVPLGQQQGQELLFSLHPIIDQLVVNSLHPDRRMLGYCCQGFEIRSMQHESLYSRLYMS